MHKTSLIDYLRTFSKRELVEFNEFVHSPYYNKHKTVIKLTEYLCQLYPRLEGEDIDRQVVYNHLFPNEAFDYNKLRHLISYTLELLEKFAGLQLIDKQPGQIARYTLLDLRTKKKDTRYRSLFNETTNLLQAQYKNIGPQHLQREVYQEGHQFFGNDPMTLELMVRQMVIIDDLFWQDKLLLACDLWSHPSFKIPFTGYKPEWMDYIASQYDKLDRMPKIKMAFHLAQALLFQEQDGWFDKGLEQLEKEAPRLDHDTYNLFLHRYHMLADHRSRISTDRDLRHFYSYYKLQINHLWLKNEGYFSITHYMEIIKLGLRLEDYQFIVRFMDQYKEQLPRTLRENTYHYALAYYYYRTKQYSKSLENIELMEPKNLQEEIEKIILPLMIYYDQKDPLHFARQMRSYYKWKRKFESIERYEADNYNRFFKLTEEAFNIVMSEIKPRKGKHERFRIAVDEELKMLPYTAHALWLREHVLLVLKSGRLP